MKYDNVEYVCLRASLVIQIIDDFTNRIVLDYPLHVWTEEGRKPIQKKDGYYVFLNIKEDLMHLHIDSAYFFSYEKVIYMKQLNLSEPVIKVRLQPNHFYPLPRGTTCIEGKIAPKTKLKVWCPTMTGYIRLMQDYRGNEDTTICIFNPNQTDIEGKAFCIVEKEKEMETFFIKKVENRKEETYLLKNSIKSDYKKMLAKIYPILLLEADEEGNFFAPIPFLEKEHSNIQIELLENKQKFEKDLVYGTNNVICLEMEGR